MVYPIAYKVVCSSLVHLLTLPIDLACTSLLTNEIIRFQMNEVNNLITGSILFVIQNLVYENLYFLDNKVIQSGCAGILSMPFYLVHELNKIKTRYGVKPNYLKINKIMIVGSIRQGSIIYFLYKFTFLNNKFFGILGTFLTNLYGIILKNYILKIGFPMIDISLNNLKRLIILDILRSSLNDYLSLQIIYNFNLLEYIYD